MTKKPETQAAQAGIGADKLHGAVTPPLYTSSTYVWPDIESKQPYDYGRSANPNRDILLATLAEMEGGTGGEITASGMAAIDLCLNLIGGDDLVIAPHDCYGGTHRLLTHRAAQNRIRVLFVDQNDDRAFEAALSQKPKLVYIESPSNPLMRLVDIKKISALSRKAGALTVCDNTFLSPARQKPLALGCDVVIHSTTKYLNGHSDVVGGVVIARDDAVIEKLRWWANAAGVTGSPFDSWLTLRGLRTLHARLNIQEANTIALAAYLEGHAQVDHVYFPGLQTDPGHVLMQRQQSGPGAMLSFELSGDIKATNKFLSSLQLFQLAPSLGGTESLICQPAIMTHGGMSPEARTEAGIKDNLIRVSVGMENIEDLIADFETGFSAVI